MGRTGWESAALVISMALASAPSARAQQQGPAPPLMSALLPPPTLPLVPELRLSWPITPLKFSFTGTEVNGYASGPLRFFRAESLWLRAPALQLWTVGSAERAFELDCRLTCQPVVQHVLDLEARVPLPQLLPGTTDTHAYLRSSSYYTTQSPRSVRLVSAGLAGAF
jgi:hypothetical protein